MQLSIEKIIIQNSIIMKIDYVITVCLGIIGCILYIIQDSIQKKLQNYIFLFLASAGIIGGIKTATLGLYGKQLKNIPDDTRLYIFIGGAVIILVSIYAGTKIFGLNVGLF